MKLNVSNTRALFRAHVILVNILRTSVYVTVSMYDEFN